MRRLALQLPSGVLRARVAGALLMVLGACALSAPFVVGRWSLALLGLPLIALSLTEAHATFKSPRRTEAVAYLPSALAMLAGNLLLVSSALVVSGLLILLLAILLLDGLGKLLSVWRRPAAERAPTVVNALVDFACAALLWYLSRMIGAEQAVGVVVGTYIAAAGWRLLMAPPEAVTATAAAIAPNVHPDPGLGLAPDEAFARLRAETDAAAPTVHVTDLMWMATLVAVFLAIHIGRMPITDTLLGIVSPFVATAGDLLMTLVFAALVVLPWRLGWRRCTRPAERLAWSLHLGAKAGSTPLRPAADRLIAAWLASRFGFSTRLREARLSLPAALILMLRLGLPVTAFFVAFNPIWGFTWYFNTESWATGVYQKMTELRVNPWRVGMIDAVARAYGSDGDELFRVRPAGVDGSGDFSFIVIGDPGEGDPSQYSLVSRYLKLGLREDVKFLVVSSDVIYPAGSMHDYEANFYLPFQGFAKPIYAIPGNHDWFDALEGFNANLLEPKAASAALEARVEADLGLTSTTARRIDRLVAEAARLRRLYGVDVGGQRAVFFELQTEDFALLAIDTGILRTIDERQWEWLERALGRSRGKFTIAIVGHPRFAGGHDTVGPGEDREGNEFPKDLGALYRMLVRNDVRVAMAGDTHDFEYYREKIGGADAARVVHHFVTGGGGAYLSIGTALAFPSAPPVDDWAFYPRTDSLRSKMEAEMPLWKQPFWHWIKWFNAWPFSVEALSGLFDFNHAPFFQSFMEVRVERSKRRVVFILNGVDGPLRWRDLQTGGAALPAGATADDPVEFIVPMDAR
jgi:Calcineurin-like phosphoesterase